MKVVCGAFIVVALAVSPAAATVKSVNILALEGSCPSAQAVSKELKSLLPMVEILENDTDEDAEAEARIEDQGAGFRIWLGESSRQFTDSSRQCGERAKSAAVFLAMTIDLPTEQSTGSDDKPKAPTIPDMTIAPDKFSIFNKATYPLTLIDRPATLPPKMARATMEFGAANVASGIATLSGTDLRPSANTGALGIAIDVGVSKRWQLGLRFDALLYDQAAFGAFRGDIEVALSRGVSFHLQFGVERIGYRDVTASPDYGPILSFGFPSKWKVHPRVAIVTGGLPGMHFNRAFPARSGTVYDSLAFVSDGLFSIHLDENHAIGSIFIPVGVLVQLHPKIALLASVGGRITMIHVVLDPIVYKWAVPLIADLILSPSRYFEVGIGYSLPGYVHDYGAAHQFGFWFRSHF